MEIRRATPDDVGEVRAFGRRYIPDHYLPLIGADAAQQQVERWWTSARLLPAAHDGRLFIAEQGSEIIGVAEWSLYEGKPVIWKLYIHPQHRGRGIGPQFLSSIIGDLPSGTAGLQVEHFAANDRAAAFYEREGFRELRTVEDKTNPALSVTWGELHLQE